MMGGLGISPRESIVIANFALAAWQLQAGRRRLRTRCHPHHHRCPHRRRRRIGRSRPSRDSWSCHRGQRFRMHHEQVIVPAREKAGPMRYWMFQWALCGAGGGTVLAAVPEAGANGTVGGRPGNGLKPAAAVIGGTGCCKPGISCAAGPGCALAIGHSDAAQESAHNKLQLCRCFLWRCTECKSSGLPCQQLLHCPWQLAAGTLSQCSDTAQPSMRVHVLMC